MPQSIGQPLRRKEDLRLLTGAGRYSDDVNLPGQAYAFILRSPHAHAVIRSIDTAAARGMPGVLAVLTGADVTADGLADVPHTPIPMKPPADILLKNRDGSPHGYAPQALLTSDRVRYVGHQVAMVVAETLAQAKDAAERITVDYQPLAPVVVTAKAAETSAPKLYDHVGNVCVDADVGDAEAAKAAFAGAARVAKLDTWVHRVTGVPLDVRAAVGEYDPASKKHTLHAGSGGVVRQKAELAGILKVEPSSVRVECGDVGGNFGTRNAFFPEFALVVWAAKRLGRPVKWTCERSDAFASD
jgi:carbon-monoxide dehydrogenase large subunit